MAENPNELWKSAAPIVKGDLADRYFRRCGSDIMEYPESLRFHERCPAEGGEHPAIMALVTGPDGKPAGLHVTLLRKGGQDVANVIHPRKVLGKAPPEGAAIRLWPAETVMGFAPCIEDALAVSETHRISCWAAFEPVKMHEWEPPEGVEDVAVFGLADPAYAGQASAYVLGNRIYRKQLAVTVQIPSVIGRMWWEVLMPNKGVAA